MRDFLDARRVVQLAALALAAAAAAFLLGYPVYDGTSVSDDGTTVATTATLAEVNGRWVVWLALAPVLLIATHAFWRGRGRTAAIVACTVPVLLLSVAGMLTVGVFFMPAVLASGIALVVPARTTSRPTASDFPSSTGPALP